MYKIQAPAKAAFLEKVKVEDATEDWFLQCDWECVSCSALKNLSQWIYRLHLSESLIFLWSSVIVLDICPEKYQKGTLCFHEIDLWGSCNSRTWCTWMIITFVVCNSFREKKAHICILFWFHFVDDIITILLTQCEYLDSIRY